MKYLILIFISLVLFSCGTRVQETKNVEKYARDITYFQDSRTGLCFGIVEIFTGASLIPKGVGLTNVPCTEEVMKIIK